MGDPFPEAPPSLWLLKALLSLPTFWVKNSVIFLFFWILLESLSMLSRTLWDPHYLSEPWLLPCTILALATTKHDGFLCPQLRRHGFSYIFVVSPHPAASGIDSLSVLFSFQTLIAPFFQILIVLLYILLLMSLRSQKVNLILLAIVNNQNKCRWFIHSTQKHKNYQAEQTVVIVVPKSHAGVLTMGDETSVNGKTDTRQKSCPQEPVRCS